ncbi:MAG TPA: caspase family protein, partial [Rhabdaerophilum sp.]|nr:caspase family protein [Rhabdaerophilum sp.]
MPISRPFERWFAAAILLLACLVAGLSGANAQGKRLGLVVGLAEYGETRHPTALQDASLVAQALKQAGFDLVEGANLSQNELRAILRDFADKVGAAGPDALVAVYVAGVGVQDDGENILIPAGARLRQKSDLGIEGLRIDDMLRVIGSMPASARIVMLDAAYAHPYAQLVADGGRGLAPIEKRDGMLVAYNHSPNQTIELPRTNYGAYAMALAEVLAEPGLELGAIFDRVRLRVHDQSQGLQTPSDVNGLTQPIVLVAPVAAAGTAPPLPAPAPRRPIAELSADEAYGRAVEIDSIKGYEEFLRAYPDHPQAKRVRAMIASRREAYYWQRARRANTSRAYWTYLKRYPNGAHAGEAEARLARLSAPVEPPADFEEVIYDDLPPPPPAEIEIYETVVVEDNWGVLPPPPGFGIIGL